MQKSTPREMRRATIELIEMLDSYSTHTRRFDAVGIAESKTKTQVAQIINNNLNNLLAMFELLEEDFNEYRLDAEVLKQIQK